MQTASGATAHEFSVAYAREAKALSTAAQERIVALVIGGASHAFAFARLAGARVVAAAILDGGVAFARHARAARRWKSDTAAGAAALTGAAHALDVVVCICRRWRGWRRSRRDSFRRPAAWQRRCCRARHRRSPNQTCALVELYLSLPSHDGGGTSIAPADGSEAGTGKRVARPPTRLPQRRAFFRRCAWRIDRENRQSSTGHSRARLSSGRGPTATRYTATESPKLLAQRQVFVAQRPRGQIGGGVEDPETRRSATAGSPHKRRPMRSAVRDRPRVKRDRLERPLLISFSTSGASVRARAEAHRRRACRAGRAAPVPSGSSTRRLGETRSSAASSDSLSWRAGSVAAAHRSGRSRAGARARGGRRARRDRTARAPVGQRARWAAAYHRD